MRIETSEQRNLPIPSIGPVIYCLPPEKRQNAKAKLTGDLRRMVECEQKILEGDFSRTASYYKSLNHSGQHFLAAASLALIGAVGGGDEVLFDTILEDVGTYPTRYPSPLSKMATNMTMAWIRQFLRAKFEVPQWIKSPDLSEIPVEWRHRACFVAVKYLQRLGERRSALLLGEAILNLDPVAVPRDSSVAIHLKMTLAHLYRDEAQLNEARRMYREAVVSSATRGAIFPFLGIALGPKSTIERTLQELAPELLKRVRRQTNDYFRNLVHFHNRFTGENVVETLSPREFYVATSLLHGFKYKQIAERMGVSQNRLHDMVKELHAKLGIRKVSELKGKVW